MVKKSEINKKGRLAKSTLSVVLAASMVLTSSSFVWAAPVEGDDITIISADSLELVGEKVEGTAPTLAGATVVLDKATFMYNGQEQKPNVVSVTVGDDVYALEELGTYGMEVVYPSDSTNVADDYKVTIQEKGNDSNKVVESYSITQNTEDLHLSSTIAGFKVGDTPPTETTNFTLSTDSISNIDIKSIVWTGDTQKPGTVTATATIADSVANNFNTTTATLEVPVTDNAATPVIIADAEVTYNGLAQAPTPDVTIGGNTLTPGTDFTYSYDNNTEAWENENNADLSKTFIATAPTVTINFTSTGSYKDRAPVSKNFEIKRKPLTNAVVEFEPEQTFTYNGKEQLPAVKDVSIKLVDGAANVKLTADDYTVEAKTEGGCIGVNDNATAVIKGKGNYTGTASTEIPFIIEARALTASSVSVSVKPAVAGLTQDALEKLITVTDLNTEKPLSIDNFDIEYENKTTSKYESAPTKAALNDYGTYNIRIRLKEGGNYTAAKDTFVYSTYTIQGESLSALTVSSLNGTTHDSAADEYYFEYNASKDGQLPTSLKMSEGDAVTPAAPSNGIFTAEFPSAEDCVNAGTYEIKLTGRNKYAGQTATVKFVIRPKQIEAGMVETFNSLTHTGDAATPYAVITHTISADETVTLVEGTDYTANVNTSAKKIEITGMGNYTTKTDSKTSLEVAYPATASKTVSLNSPAVKAEVKGTYNYTGRPIIPQASDIVVTETGSTSTYPLVKDRDYTVTYKNNTNVGTATVILKGIGDFEGEREVSFEIIGPEVSSLYKLDTSAVTKTEFPYSGVSQETAIKTEAEKVIIRNISTNARKQPKEIKYYRDGKEIKSVTDQYTTPGTITAEYTMENTSGTLKVVFSIVGKPLSEAAVIGDKIADQQYTGQEIKPAIAVTPKDSAVILTEGKDYTIEYKNNVNVGQAYAIVNGIGNYDGAYLVTFNIVGTEIKDAVVTAENTVYTGKALTPAVTVKLGDKELAAGTDYIAEYKDNTNAGTASVTVTGMGGYQGTASTTFTIAKADQKLAVSKAIANALKIRNTNANTYTLKVTGAGTKLSYKSSNTKIATVSSTGKLSFKHVCGKATITVTAAADDNHNAATLKVAVAVKPATPRIAITARTKGFNAKATAVKDITGYQVGYSTDKNFAASKTTKKLVKTTKALNKNFSGLSAKKGYYVRVRAYKKVGSTVYWGNWTSAKKITTK